MESFLVRLWRPEPNERLDPGVRGVIRRIGTGEERVFASETELLAFLRSGVVEGTRRVERPRP